MLTKLEKYRFNFSSIWIELLLITLFGLWVGSPYLNFSQFLWPIGNEFASILETHYIWNLLPKCGLCMLWNGGLNGGAPAFAELEGSILHPVTVLTTLIWGVVNGDKVGLVISFIMAGWAQWWIAKTLKLGRTARLWSGAIAIVSGHLAGRLELGLSILSVSSCTLIIAPGLSTALNGRRRDIVLFGVMTALAVLSGGGYIQAGMFLGMIPAFLIFIVNSQSKLTPALKNFALAAIIAVLLSGILWVPVVHLWPNIQKNDDPTFNSAQPLAYEPLNLVISDRDFQYSTVLGKLPYPVIHSIYIGWIPILFAVLAFRAPKTKKEIKVFLFFITSIVLIFLTSSAILLKGLSYLNPYLAGMIRFPSMLSTLSAPYILALSAWGLDWLIKKAWPQIELKTESFNIKLSTRLLLAIPLIWAIVSCYNFGRNWIVMQDIPSDLWRIAEEMKTQSAAWVSFPFGDHPWMVAGQDVGLKIGTGITHFTWKNRDFPPSTLSATHDPVDQTSPNFKVQIAGVNITENRDVYYAYILNGNQKTPCQAIANGGNIDVTCDSDKSGTLEVTENVFSGWKAKIDGKPTQLVPNEQWLAVNAPAGNHKYEFRYRPWDVLLGLLLTLLGIGLIFWVLFSKPKKESLNDPALDN